MLVLALGFRLGWSLELRTLVAAVIALAIVQFLARGMTSPLRESLPPPVEMVSLPPWREPSAPVSVLLDVSSLPLK